MSIVTIITVEGHRKTKNLKKPVVKKGHLNTTWRTSETFSICENQVEQKTRTGR